jgi:hypothetical protein
MNNTKHDQQGREGSASQGISCTVARASETMAHQATLIAYTHPLYILAVNQQDRVEYTPGALVGVSEDTPDGWYRITSSAQAEVVDRALRPFPLAGGPADSFQRFGELSAARAFVEEVTKPRWFIDLSGRQLQAKVEATSRDWGVAPDIWITEPALILNGSHPSLQIGEAGAVFSLVGSQQVVGVTEGMGCLQIELPEVYGHERAWFEPGSGIWTYVELRYPQADDAAPIWTVGDNRER